MQIKASEIERQAELGLQAIERTFELSIALHDLRGTICHPDGKVVLPQRHLHRSPCCLYKRKERRGWDDLCFSRCFTQSEKEAGGAGRPFMKSCWKGLCELVVPLMHGSRHSLTIYAGVFKERGFKPGPELAKEDEYLAMLERLPEKPGRKKLEELGALLTVFGHGLLSQIGEEADEEPGRGAAIRRFVESQAQRQIGIRDLARHLRLSPSRASHAAKEHTGMSFQDLLLKERMARARTLLLRSEEHLGGIALKTGFKNAFYFNRVFKLFYGIPPGEFRRCGGRGAKVRAGAL